MTTLNTIILSALAVAILIYGTLLIIDLIQAIRLYKKTCALLEESIKIQADTIANQKITIEHYKKILAMGIVINANDKIRAN